MPDDGRGGTRRIVGKEASSLQFQLVAALVGDSRRLRAVIRDCGWGDDADAVYRAAERLHDRGWLAIDAETGLYRVRPVAAEALAAHLTALAHLTDQSLVPDDGPDVSVRTTTLGGAE
jgi:hypothetical protein